MIALNDLKHDILQECEEDHVGLWSVVRDVRVHFPDANDDEIRETTLKVLSELLSADEIVAGHPATDGQGFVPSSKPVALLLGDIRDEWNQLGREPTIGEIIWFTTPTPSRID